MNIEIEISPVIYKCKKCSNQSRNKESDFILEGKKYKTCNVCRSKKAKRCPHMNFKQYCEHCCGVSLCYKEEKVIRKDQCKKCKSKDH